MEPEKKPEKESTSVLLSKQRTSLSFQRTRLAADSNLMSIMQASLSLIAFGFTIFQFFRSLYKFSMIDAKLLQGADNLGLTLVGLGIGMLFLGIIYHLLFMSELRKKRKSLRDLDLLTNGDSFPVSLIVIIAFLLLLIGIYAIYKMMTEYS